MVSEKGKRIKNIPTTQSKSLQHTKLSTYRTLDFPVSRIPLSFLRKQGGTCHFYMAFWIYSVAEMVSLPYMRLGPWLVLSPREGRWRWGGPFWDSSLKKWACLFHALFLHALAKSRSVWDLWDIRISRREWPGDLNRARAGKLPIAQK